MSKFKATELIVKDFDESGIKYRVDDTGTSEAVSAGFSIDCGPSVTAKFISTDNDNDVSVRLFGVVNNVPEAKRARIYEACNVVNSRYRYLKFCIDKDGDVNIEYDFPVRLSDSSVGPCATEIFIRLMKIADAAYKVFMTALFSDGPITAQD